VGLAAADLPVVMDLPVERLPVDSADLPAVVDLVDLPAAVDSVDLPVVDLLPADLVDLPVVDLPVVTVMAHLPEGLADRPKVGLADLRKVDMADLRWVLPWADRNSRKRSPIPA